MPMWDNIEIVSYKVDGNHAGRSLGAHSEELPQISDENSSPYKETPKNIHQLD